MDRIELALEKLITGHQKLVDAQEVFAEQPKQLLNSQILLTDRMDRLAVTQDKLTEAQIQTEEQMKATDARLSMLIGMMDTFIRERGDAR